MSSTATSQAFSCRLATKADILPRIIEAIHEARLCDHPRYLYLGVSDYASLITFARSNLKMYMMVPGEEGWGKEMFMNMEVVRVDKFEWLKVGL
jgi:hypothetical protein